MGLIIGAVDYIRSRMQNNPCWWCDPMACVIRSLWCCLEGIIGGLSRFALITHMFHGHRLREVAPATFGLLKQRLPDLFTTSFLAEKVTSQMSICLATMFGLLTWIILDTSEGLGFFKFFGDAVVDVSKNSDDLKNTQFMIVGLLLLMFFWCVIQWSRLSSFSRSTTCLKSPGAL